MLMEDLTLILRLLQGYTIERFIHGMDAAYNDIAEWNWSTLPFAFGAEEHKYKTYQVRTKEDVAALLNDEAFANGTKLRVSR